MQSEEHLDKAKVFRYTKIKVLKTAIDKYFLKPLQIKNTYFERKTANPLAR